MYAGLFKRFCAYSIDYFLIALLQFSLSYIFSIKNQTFGFILMIAICIAYFLIEGFLFEGQSPGKKLLKLKVFSVINNELTISQKIFRVFYFIIVPALVISMLSFLTMNFPSKLIFAISFIIYCLFFVALLLFLFHPQNRSIVDILTKSAVIDLKKATGNIEWLELNKKGLVLSVSIAVPIFILIFFQLNKFKYFEIFEKSALLTKTIEKVTQTNTYFNVMPFENGEYDLVMMIQFKDGDLEKHQNDKFKYIDAILSLEDKIKISSLQIIYIKSDGYNVKKITEDAAVINKYLNLKQCDKGKAISCYHLGNLLNQKENKPEEALIYLDKACNQGVSVACSNAGYTLYSLNKSPDRQLYYAERACEMGDYLGCSNSACNYCRRNNKEAAIKSLEKSLEILKKSKEFELEVLRNSINDSELDCVKDSPVWSEYLKFVNNLQKK